MKLRNYSYIILGLFSVFFALKVYAEQEALTQDLKNSEKVIIACSKGSAPFHFADSEGNAVGIFVDIWNLWSKRTGVEIVFKTMSWGETLQAMRDGTADIHAGLFYSEERNEYLDYVAELEKSDTHFFYHKDIYGANSLADLKPFKVGIVKGDFAVNYINKNYPDITIVLYEGNEELFNAIENNEIKVFIKDTPIALYHLSKRGLLYKFKHHTQKPLYSNMFHVAVAKDNKNLANVVLSGLKLISAEEKAILTKKWLGSSAIKVKDVVRVGIPKELPPFAMLDYKNKPTGFLVDVWNLWAEKSGMLVDFEVFERNNLEHALKENEIDVISWLLLNYENSKKFEFSNVFYRTDACFMCKKKTYSADFPENISSRSVGVVKGSPYEAYVKNKYSSAHLNAYDDVSELMHAIVEDKVDFVFEDLIVGLNVLGRMGHFAEFIYDSKNCIANNIYAGVVKDNKTLLESINNGFKSLTIEELKKIEQSWIRDSRLRHWSGDEKTFVLTEEEKLLFKKFQLLNVGLMADYFPYTFVNKEQEYDGISKNYLDILNMRLGVVFDYNFFEDLSEIAEMFVEKKVDLLPAVERGGYLSDILELSEPYLELPVVMIVRKDAPMLVRLEDVARGKLAVVENSSIERKLKSDYPHMMFIPVMSTADGLSMLFKGKVNVFVGDIASVGYVTKMNDLRDLKIGGTLDFKYEICIGVRKELSALVGVFNKVLASLSDVQKEYINSQWLNVRFQQRANWKLLLMVILIFVAISLSIIFIFIFANRNLSKEVDHRRKIQHELIDAKAMAEHANVVKSEFLANMSHELRTPLNAIIGFSEVLQDKTFGDINEKQRKYLENILESGHHLLELINDILDLSKVETGKMELEREEFDLVHLIESSLILIKEKALKHHIKIIKDFDDLEAKVLADERRFRQIMYNLLSNAIKFTPDGESIGVRVSKTDMDELMITVWDTGIGIGEADKDKVFKEFEQIDSAYSRKYAGTGLGMPLTKKLVNLHGGRMWFESEGKDKGTSFYITFPRHTQEDLGVKQADSHSRDLEHYVFMGNALIVEKDREIAELFAGYLNEYGFETKLIFDCQEVKHALKKERYDLIMLDVLLAENDGWGILSELKTNQHMAGIPVILVGTLEEENVKKEVVFAPQGILTKPLEKKKLYNTLDNLFLAFTGCKVLVIDDDPNVCEMINDMLNKKGFDVTVAQSGKHGLEILRKNVYDAVLLDLIMPEMSGFDVLEEMQGDSSLSEIPVVVITSKDITIEETKYLAGKIESIIKKDHFDKNLLFKLLSKLVKYKD